MHSATVFILVCYQYVKVTAVLVLPEDSEYTRGWWRCLIAPAHDVRLGASSSQPRDGLLAGAIGLGATWVESEWLRECRLLATVPELC